LVLVGYLLLAHHYSGSPAEDGGRSVAIALLPWLIAGIVFAWRSRHRLAWLLACTCLALVAWHYVAAIGHQAAWFYFAQHVAGNLILAAVFGRSLTGDRVPLCSRIAAATHGNLEPRIALYTRRVTLAWTLFFAGTALLSTLLFAFAPIAAWSLFANLLALPLVALMFIVEYLVRLRVLPDVEHGSILDGVRGYLGSARASTPPMP
jgi:uncharacterized membrane protein